MGFFKRLTDLDVVSVLRLSDFFDVEDVWNVALLEISVRISKDLDKGARGHKTTILKLIRDGDSFITSSIASAAFTRSTSFQRAFLSFAATTLSTGSAVVASSSSSSSSSSSAAFTSKLQAARKGLCGSKCTCESQQPQLVTALDQDVSTSIRSLCNFCIFGTSLSETLQTFSSPALFLPLSSLYSLCYFPFCSTLLR